MAGATISQRYFEELPRLRVALRLWRGVIEGPALDHDPAAVISGRVKTHRSVLGKVYRRGKARPWESLGDLVAFKAIFPTSHAASAFADWIDQQESWHPVLDRKVSAPDRLAYQSMQFDLWCDRVLDSRGQPVKVELQVRTAAADAWYVVDHRLRYKGSIALPSEVERRLYRLIVLTELFDQEVEAVIEAQATLPEYGAARIYEDLARQFDELVDGHAKTSRPEGLLELLLLAYTDEELPHVAELVGDFLTVHRDVIGDLIMARLHESEDFVESRDWLYYEPETLLVAERAHRHASLLADRVRGSDFESAIATMSDRFSQAIPFEVD